MASSSIISWPIEGENVEAVTNFLFLGSKITADDDRSHKIRRWLFLGRKAMTNLDSILKIKDITLPTKVCIVEDIISSEVTYGCESWTVKNAEHQRIDAFELWCWRRLLRVSWKARRSNQSIYFFFNFFFPNQTMSCLSLASLQCIAQFSLINMYWLGCWKPLQITIKVMATFSCQSNV